MTGELKSEELKTGLFDYINDISYDKKRLADNDAQFEKNYNVFMVGRWASYQIDSVHWANALNLYGSAVTKREHYDFLYHVLKRQKRYGKWHKEVKSDQIDAICEYYSINKTQAEAMLELISKDELDHILRAKGGKLK